jgi:hypothetical protein
MLDHRHRMNEKLDRIEAELLVLNGIFCASKGARSRPRG